MNLNELYTEVARKADTESTSINIAEVSRVCSLLFQELKLKLNLRIAQVEGSDEIVEIYDSSVAEEIMDIIIKS